MNHHHQSYRNTADTHMSHPFDAFHAGGLTAQMLAAADGHREAQHYASKMAAPHPDHRRDRVPGGNGRQAPAARRTSPRWHYRHGWPGTPASNQLTRDRSTKYGLVRSQAAQMSFDLDAEVSEVLTVKMDGVRIDGESDLRQKLRQQRLLARSR